MLCRLALRRALLVAAMTAVTAALIAVAVRAIGGGGWTPVAIALLGCYAANAPWLALSVVTGVVDFAIRVGARDPLRAVLPALARADGPIRLRTAIAVCTRDEAVAPIAAHFSMLAHAIAAAGLSDRFALCLLSDTVDDTIAAAECAAMRALAGPSLPRALYRRRAENTGWKAGNVMSFLDEVHRDFDLLLCLDADSAMSLPAILRLVRIMQADARLAIVQPIFAAHGARTRFARLAAIANGAGMRLWATGQAWWQSGSGPYWGHNAALRVAPFRENCRLPPLPDGSAILSHDHVEAARLHAAGWAVRVLPDDMGSFEQLPPTLLDHLARDERWAAGNLQYRKLLRDRSLSRIGRLQMLQAMTHYAVAPLFAAMLPLAALGAVLGSHAPAGRVAALMAVSYGAAQTPRLLGHAEAMWRGAPAGHALRVLGDLLNAVLLEPVLSAEKTVIVLRLLAGRRVGWHGQHREGRATGWRAAARRFWPHALIGSALLACFAAPSWRAALVAAPAVAGLLLAIPYAVVTSREPRRFAAMRLSGSVTDNVPQAARGR